MNILLVDDNSQNRRLLRITLEHYDCRVTEAENGQDGLQKARDLHPDLIISDALMPIMDGFELLRAIRLDPGLGPLPFVFYSAVYTGEREQELAKALGANAFLPKPLEPEQLWQALQPILAAGRDNVPQITQPVTEDEEFLRRYSSIVAAKLEEKVNELNTTRIDLEQSRRHYRDLYNSLQDAVVVTDLEPKIVDANQPALRNLFGYELEEVIGQPPLILHEKEDDYREILETARRQQKPTEISREPLMRHKDGSCFASRLNLNYLIDETGEHSGFIGIIRDIRAQRLAEHRLRQSEKDWERTFNAIPDIVTLQDRDNIIMRANRATCETFHTTEEELIGLHCEEIFTGGGHICSDCPLGQEPPHYNSHTGEFFHPAINKTLLVSCTQLLDDQGELVGIAHFAKDITERKKLATQLHQAQKMESIGNLAGGIAHDFNNMLAVILGYTESALNKVTAEDPLSRPLKGTLAAAQRSAKLTRQLLAFSRRQPMQPERLDLNKQLHDSEALLRRVISEDIALHFTLCPEKTPVFLDPGHLDQIIVNLAVNARDAMPEGGSIHIATRCVSFADSPGLPGQPLLQGEFILLSISDTGCGMDRRTREQVFEPFFTTKEKDKGTGLGLATVYGIVTQNQGAINLYSEVGLGSTFNIYLPLYHGTEKSRAPEATSDESLFGNETILLVEDEELVRRLTRETLEDLGYRVLSAACGEEALSVWDEQGENIDLLLTDVVMPGLNGKHLAEKLIQQQPGLKVIFMSGYSEDVIAHGGLLDQGIIFLQKPFPKQQLAKALRKRLGKE